MLAAAVSAWLSTRPRVPCAFTTADRHARHWAAGGRWLAASFLSGFCLLALEVVWFRFLVLFVKGHSTAFPLMLAIVLAGIALGGLAAAFWLRRAPDAHRLASPVAFSAGLLCVISYAAFPRIIEPLALSTITTPLAILHIGAPLMFPVSFLSGIFFTLLGAALRSHLTSETETAGVLTLANTTGAALGSLTAGFVLLPLLGMERSFFLIAVLYGGIGFLAWRPVKGAPYGARRAAQDRVRKRSHVSRGPRALSVWIDGGAPASDPGHTVGSGGGRQTSRGGSRRADRDRHLLRAVDGGKPVSYVMLTNSFSMSTTGYGVRRYQKLYVYWPMAVHPDLKRALLIGYGVGNTAKAMTDSRSLETIDVVDLSRDILAMNRIVYPDEADQPLDDPRVRVHIEDGRYFLQTTDRRFDLITGEPPPPGIAGVENLYTREYFQLLHDRLAEGGIATYWLPLSDLSDVSARAILRAFCDVFEDCSLWNGSGTNLMMVGTRNAQAARSRRSSSPASGTRRRSPPR